ncbi:hypothetical protein BJX63DRAFT_101994 [Aspergillus granulosus]|uniref:Zn(2)-C6 fungal-type domain-containing protein n=1 Tax=Aspergillus granulosus TaxID=176169 RepID=A0ABR4HQ01_9EURO
MRSLNAPRTKTGCWTCRARKIKCDETKPQCAQCRPRNRDCQYGHRPRRTRRHGTTASPLPPPLIAPADLRPSSATLPPATSTSTELPYGIQSMDWPLPLTEVDKQAIQHYVDDVVPRMVLKSPRWSTYSYVLFMCTQHPMLAHLLLAFSIRDMMEGRGGDTTTAALEHYQGALSLFIWHLRHPAVQSWVTFPALWLFILYEQTYGDDPRVLQAHLRGLHDMIRSDGSSILSLSVDTSRAEEPYSRYRVPREFLNRMALWTVHYDARASTFGLDGGIIDLLNERYPGSITAMCETSKDGLRVAWGPEYPAAEDLWDAQIDPLWSLDHRSVMLRFKLSRLEHAGEDVDPSAMRGLGYELKALETEFSPFISLASSRALERSTRLSNTCAAVANFFALVVLYDRLMYDIQSPVVSSILPVIASLHEYEGDSYLWHVAWALFVVAFETNDPIHQAWILERFTHMQKNGRNMGRARSLLESLFLEKRKSGGRVRYSDWIRDGRFPHFMI